MRSQSPPRLTQRYPVSATHAAIASRSISPYMWSTSGPRSIVPECGEGIEAITGRDSALRAGRLPQLASKQDAQRKIRGATALEQLDRDMKINVMSHRKSTSCARLVPGSLELFRSPPLDALHLGGSCQGDVSDRHAVLSRRLPSLFGQTTGADLPIGGDFDFSQKIYEAVRAIRSASSFVRPPSSRSVTLPTCQT